MGLAYSSMLSCFTSGKLGHMLITAHNNANICIAHDCLVTLIGLLLQGHLKNLMGKPSGLIQELPTKVQGRIEYLRQLQDKHSDLEEQFQQELAALKAKFYGLYGKEPDRRHISTHL